MNRYNGVMGKNKDCLLGKLVDYNQDSIKSENDRSFLMKSIEMEFYGHSGIESCLRDL